jgi:SAM-dependent methyltransferase
MAAAPELSKVNYGQDSPFAVKDWRDRAIWTAAFAALIWYINHEEYPGVALDLLLVLGGLAVLFFGISWFMTWSSQVGKLALRDRLVDSLDLKGDEKVLDVGCGRGLMTIAVAKRLKSGRADGVDLWDTMALDGNSGDAARANAKLEGIGDKVRFEQGDARKLRQQDGSFDVVTCVNALHCMDDEPDRDDAVRELYRVTKPGGRILIADTRNVARYAEILKGAGAADIQISSQGFLWCLPAKSLLARK